MERNALLEAVRGQMPEKRWNHTLGVMETSVILAKRFGADPEKADLAAILHDVAKYWPIDRMAETIRDGGLPAELLEQDKELWHAHVGAYAAATEYGVNDEDVLNAIRYHTSGRDGMSKLEMVVCLADYMEPGRSFPGVDKIRELAEHSLERALIAGFDTTIAHLLEKGKRIDPQSVLARNDLIMRMKKEAD